MPIVEFTVLNLEHHVKYSSLPPQLIIALKIPKCSENIGHFDTS